jgi:hypothetical protein
LDDNTLQQRIKYLVEHGGVWDDPLADIRRRIRLLKIMVLALVLTDVLTVLFL